MDPDLPRVPAQYRGGEVGQAGVARKENERLEMLMAFSCRETRSVPGSDAAALRPHRIRWDADLRLRS